MMKSNVVEKELVNFNIPVNIKRNFIDVCRMKGTNMTSTVINFMSGFVQSEGEKIKEELDRIKEIENKLKDFRTDRSKKKVDKERLSFFKS